MARIRTIKPDFFTSESINNLPNDFVRLLFIALWTYVDDDGKGIDNAKVICGGLFPLRDDISPSDVREGMNALELEGLIEQYDVDGKSLFRVCTWREHQKINKPSKSRIPDPEAPGQLMFNEAITEDSVNTPVVLPVGKGKGKGNGKGKGSGKGVALAERKTDEVWDSVIYVCRIDDTKLTKSERSNIGKTVRELKDVGATASDVLERAASYRMAYPDAALTVNALVKHWSSAGGVATQPKVSKHDLELNQWAAS